MKNMAMDFEDVTPEEFHDFALELNDIKNDLDSSESIINRTIYMRIYYSVFLFLREWLKKYTKYISRPNGEHSKLPRFIKFNGPFSNELNEEISEDIIHLKILRHQADYKLNVPSDEKSQEYLRWKFTSINSAFIIAEKIFNLFLEYDTS